MILVVAAAALFVAGVDGRALVVTREKRSADDVSPVENNNQTHITRLHIDTHIKLRYARTSVTSHVENGDSASREVEFTVTLPETAFVVGFLMEVGGQTYVAHVKEKDAARREYNTAVREGRTAGHVALSPRDTTRFTVSAHVEALSEVTFNLTYEELLSRRLGVYQHVVSVDPGQVVPDLSVAVSIQESSFITTLQVPALLVSNEISEADGVEPLAVVTRPSPTRAEVRWAPSAEEQRARRTEGMRGQLEVRYDVDRQTRPGEVLMDDGYFVHFFASSDLTPFNKHVTFVLDQSGSMAGRKMQQLKEAMQRVLADLRSGDYFSVVLFSANAQVYSTEGLPVTVNDDTTLDSSMIVPATTEAITIAKNFIASMTVRGSTNIEDALKTGLRLLQLGRTVLPTSLGHSDLPQPILVFLTDGEPTTGTTGTEQLTQLARRLNSDTRAPVFSLAFGAGADFAFLKRLSLTNHGFARKIYEASDAALQLEGFYRQVASPQLANVTFRYQNVLVDDDSLTLHNFATLFDGGELVVSGRIRPRTGRLPPAAPGQPATAYFATLEAVSPSGRTSYYFDPEVLPPHEDTTSSLERLWAYLTVRQLLDKASAEEGTSVATDAKQRALQLALQYSFVTPVTSLVVTKPNGTSEAAATADNVVDLANEDPDRKFGYPGITTRSGNISPRGPGGVRYAAVTSGSRRRNPGNRGRTATTTTHAIPTLVPLSSIVWLDSSSAGTTVRLPTGVDGAEETLSLGTGEVNEPHNTCSSPAAVASHCRHLPHCPLNVFQSNVAHIVPYFCRIGSFAGVCCPDSLVGQT